MFQLKYLFFSNISKMMVVRSGGGRMRRMRRMRMMMKRRMDRMRGRRRRRRVEGQGSRVKGQGSKGQWSRVKGQGGMRRTRRMSCRTRSTKATDNANAETKKRIEDVGGLTIWLKCLRIVM